MTERYCVPKSLPCWFNVVGSWITKNISSSSRYEICCGSNSMRTTSACPVVPLQTSAYVGPTTCPPEYPDSTSITPCTSSYTASRHQKQPPPSVANSWPGRGCAANAF